MTDHAGAIVAELGGPGVDWFDRVHLLPRGGIAFGVVVTETSESFDLFSAFRSNVFLTNFVNGAPDSIDVPDLPALTYTQKPFSSLRDPSSVPMSVVGMTVVALAQTQASFADTLDFVFDAGTYSLLVSGVRVGFVLPEFDGEVEERLEWSTDILKKSAGKAEQRIARRENPRQAFIIDMLPTEAQRRRWANVLFGAQDALFALPLWHDRLVLTAAVIATATSATVASTLYCDLRVGGLVALYSSDSVYDVLEVATVTATTVTFASGTVNAYAAGSFLMPARIASIESNIRGARYPFALESYQVRFDVVDNDTGAPAGDTSGFSTFGGRVLLDDYNVIYGATNPQSSTRVVTVIDNGTGQVSRVSRWDRSKHGFPFGFSPKTRQALWRVRTLLIALRGPQTSFWVPTSHDDLVPTQNLTNATATLVVENCGYATFVASATGRNKIRVTFTDGTTATRGISSAVETSATEETLTVDSVWTSTKTPAQVSRIEFLELVRLDSDDVEIKHKDVGRATIQVPAMMVIET